MDLHPNSLQSDCKQEPDSPSCRFFTFIYRFVFTQITFKAFKQMHITPFSGLIAALNYTHRDLKLEPRAEAQQCFQTLYDSDSPYKGDNTDFI